MKPGITAYVTVALVGTLTAAPILANEPESAFSRSIVREAARLATEGSAQDDARWLHVQRLPFGTTIVVSTRDGVRHTRRFVKADDSQLTVEASAGMPESIVRGDILEIKTAPMGWASHNKQLFGVIGGLAGAVAGGAIAYDYKRGSEGVYRAQLGLWPGLGAGVATGLILAGKYQRTIYRSGG